MRAHPLIASAFVAAFLCRATAQTFAGENDPREEMQRRISAMRAEREMGLHADGSEGARVVANAELDKEALALLSGFDAPKRMDLNAANESVDAVLAKIKTHFGPGIKALDDTGKKQISVSIKGATMFEAIDAVRKAAGLAYAPLTIDMLKTLADSKPGSGGDIIFLHASSSPLVNSTVAVGPLILYVEQVTVKASRRINFVNVGAGAGGESGVLTAQCTLIVEPALRFSILKGSGGSNDKNAFVPASQAHLHSITETASHNEGAPRYYTFSINLPYNPLDTPGTLSLKADFKFKVPLKANEKRYDKLTDIVGDPLNLMGATFTLKSIEADGNDWRVKYGTTGGAFGRTQLFNISTFDAAVWGSPAYAPGIRFLNAKGVPIRSRRTSGSSSGSKGSEYNAEFSEQPTAITTRELIDIAVREYSLALPDVPIPK